MEICSKDTDDDLNKVIKRFCQENVEVDKGKSISISFWEIYFYASCAVEVYKLQ